GSRPAFPRVSPSRARRAASGSLPTALGAMGVAVEDPYERGLRGRARRGSRAPADPRVVATHPREPVPVRNRPHEPDPPRGVRVADRTLRPCRVPEDAGRSAREAGDTHRGASAGRGTHDGRARAAASTLPGPARVAGFGTRGARHDPAIPAHPRLGTPRRLSALPRASGVPRQGTVRRGDARRGRRRGRLREIDPGAARAYVP